jgi:hypothetical protein
METGVYPIHTSWCTIPIKKACSGNPSIPGKFSGGSNLIMRKTYCGWKKILYQLGTIRYLRNTVNNGRKMGKTIYQLDLKSIHHYLPLLSTLPKTSFFCILDAFDLTSQRHENSWWLLGESSGGSGKEKAFGLFLFIYPSGKSTIFFLWMVPQYSEYSWYLEWFYFGGTPNQLKSKYQTRWFRTKGVVSHQDILQRSCIPERLDVFVGFLYRVDFWRLKSLAFAHINQGTETITMW